MKLIKYGFEVLFFSKTHSDAMENFVIVIPDSSTWIVTTKINKDMQ